MTLSEELTWRGLFNQTTYPKLEAIDGQPISFYWGVDPSADSMTVGNLATAMMVRQFIKHGHKPYLLVGGATGLIGDPDGKSSERELLSQEQLEINKAAITKQYHQIFQGAEIKLVDNYDWFKDYKFLDFLRDVGKHVPTRQMLAREFVQSRLGEEGNGISYAEFSYVLIQAYDFLHLFENHNVTLQLSGSDQWGNCIAGVDLIRRKNGGEAHVYSAPLLVNPITGQKFGKTEEGAIWLDPNKTTPTKFYQFWINTSDEAVGSYLKIFTDMSKQEVEQLMAEHETNPGARKAQIELAKSVTTLVHGDDKTKAAIDVTDYLIGNKPIGEADASLDELRAEIPSLKSTSDGSVISALVESGLASSNSEARRLIIATAVTINDQKINREHFESGDYQNGRLLLRRGKAFKDSALIEL
jgi:tyrosyl-tRNA synthetase